MMKEKSKGFTLVELLTAMVVAGILLALAVPAYTTMVKNNRMLDVTNALVGAVNFARMEAVRRNSRITMCKSANGTSCGGASVKWSDGWIIFEDEDNDAVKDANEDLIRVHGSLHSTMDVSGNTNVASYISFIPSGRPQLTSGAFQSGTISICDDRAGDFGRDLVLSLAGRMRVERGVTCP